jgi:hypothetical protein
MKLLSNESAKLNKSQNENWLNAILYLEPSYNGKVCPNATKGCKRTCLINSGMMKMPVQTNARLKRTELYFENKEVFLFLLRKEIEVLIRKATKQNKRLALRLNGTSDLDFTRIYKEFPSVQFYEYTKRTDLLDVIKELPNVHLTVSATENTTKEDFHAIIKKGYNIATVFDMVPLRYNDIKVVDGDTTDRRFEDETGVIVGLKFKGSKALKENAIKLGFCRK